MPQRTSEHIVADRATNAVEKLIADAGFAPEPVKNDYGEDILVQTSHGGMMDASRMWIQVKGTESLARYRRRGGDMSYSVPTKHILRWARSADPVIVILWDIRHELGYYAIIPDDVRPWDSVIEPMAKSAKVVFASDHVFDVTAVATLAWASRMRRSRGLLLDAVAREEDEEMKLEGGEIGHKMKVVVVLDLLESLGMVESENDAYRLTPIASNLYEEQLRALVAALPSRTVDDLAQALWSAATFTFMDHVYTETGGGVYREHMLVVGEVIMCLFKPPDDLRALVHSVQVAHMAEGLGRE